MLTSAPHYLITLLANVQHSPCWKSYVHSLLSAAHSPSRMYTLGYVSCLPCLLPISIPGPEAGGRPGKALRQFAGA